MRILFVTSEVDPFSKTGGLADVSAALPRHLGRLGHDVRIFSPLYERVARSNHTFTRIAAAQDIEISLGPWRYTFSLLAAELPDSNVHVYFVDCPALYARPSIYTGDDDEHRRFLLLQRAALESAQRLGFAPDVVHCNDWQCGLIPLLLKVRYAWDRLFANTRTVLTIHNLNYQGSFSAKILPETGLADSAHLLHQEHLAAGRVGFLLSGIIYADMLTTVSPTYAREIQTPEHGAGLDLFLRARNDHLVGILNGVDAQWNPATDPLIPYRYDADDISPKEDDKRELLESLGLRYAPRAPTIGIVSRLASQKGFELCFDVLPQLLDARRDARLVVLGSGESRFEELFAGLQRAFPGRAVLFTGFQNKLAHLIEAGADMFLMPSRYEPCGLNQMYSQRYGTPPVARATGGLADTIADGETGFLFERAEAGALLAAARRAVTLWRDELRRLAMQRAGMARDFGWTRSARRYAELYARLAVDRPAAVP